MPLLLLLTSGALAMGSPWWEDYTSRDVFLCPNDGRVVLERNDAQASLLSGRFRSTLFREDSGGGSIRYRNEWMTVILRGDVLTMERLPSRVDCLRTEQV
jgi:hypothetical protein